MDNNNKYKTNRVIAIPLMPVLVSFIIVIVLIIFSLNIYATYINEEENKNIVTNITLDNISNSDEDNSKNTIKVVLNDTNNIEEISIEEESIENNETASNEENLNIETTNTVSNEKGYNVIATLNIPSLGIQYPILSTTSDELLKISLTKYWGANPNEVGNMVILGHNFKDGKFFSKLPNIQKNSIIQITDLSGRTLEYKVYDTSVIDPYDNTCTSQLTDGHTEVTLITCFYENGNVHATKRFYVKARAY